MEVFSDIGAMLSDMTILEAVALTLAGVIMLGPLVPYAISGRRERRSRLAEGR